MQLNDTDRAALVYKFAQANDLALLTGGPAPAIASLKRNRDLFSLVRLSNHVNQGGKELTRKELRIFRAQSTIDFLRERWKCGEMKEALLIAAEEAYEVDLAVAAAMVATERDDETYLRDFAVLVGYDRSDQSMIMTAMAEVLSPLQIDKRGRVNYQKNSQAKQLVKIVSARDYKAKVRELIYEKRLDESVITPQTVGDDNDRDKKGKAKQKPILSLDELTEGKSKKVRKIVANAYGLNARVAIDVDFEEYVRSQVCAETFAVFKAREADDKRSEIGNDIWKRATYELRKVAASKWRDGSRVVVPKPLSQYVPPDLLLGLSKKDEPRDSDPFCKWGCGRKVRAGECTEDRDCFLTLINNLSRGQEPNY
jgi:hypothetical protein